MWIAENYLSMIIDWQKDYLPALVDRQKDYLSVLVDWQKDYLFVLVDWKKDYLSALVDWKNDCLYVDWLFRVSLCGLTKRFSPLNGLNWKLFTPPLPLVYCLNIDCIDELRLRLIVLSDNLDLSVRNDTASVFAWVSLTVIKCGVIMRYWEVDGFYIILDPERAANNLSGLLSRLAKFIYI